jgi:hypothetical protein
MTLPELCREAARRGLRLEPRGGKLAVIPASRCPPEFADLLRQHKVKLLDLLEAKSTNLTPDCVPWLHVARQILAGEFDGLLDSSVRDSLEIGLRGILHPLCRRALERLRVASRT